MPDQAVTDAADVWDSTVAPGGYVCAGCGVPTESEPCEKHQPAAYREATRTTPDAEFQQ